MHLPIFFSFPPMFSHYLLLFGTCYAQNHGFGGAILAEVFMRARICFVMNDRSTDTIWGDNGVTLEMDNEG